jgi:glycosyltransferase involved in cell wall biosynthesis
VSRTLRVAMLIQAYHPRIGGAERQLAAQARRLQQGGIDVHVITRRYPGMRPFEYVNDIPVHRMHIPGSRSTAAASYISSALLKIAVLRPDVIHAHELLSPATTAILAKWLYRIPVVAKVLRGGALGDLTKIGAGTWGRMRTSVICKAIDRFAVISREIDGELAAVGVPEEKRVLIPNGVDIERYAPPTAEEKTTLRSSLGLPDAPLVIFSGRLDPEKRLGALLSLWPQIRTDVPAAVLLILGTGSLEKELRQQAGDGVRLLGPVEDVSSYLKAADLFLLPSVGEGLSNALLEAMACGLPCIATRVGGTVDVIQHSRNGWLIQPDSSEELCSALLFLLHHIELRANLGAEARRAVTTGYSLSVVVTRLQKLYRQMVAER